MDMYNMSESRKEIDGRLYTFSWPNNAPINEVYEFLTENLQTFVNISKEYEKRNAGKAADSQPE